MKFSDFSIETDGVFGMWLIKRNGKGSVPKKLRGRYSEYKLAKHQLDRYISSKEGLTNGKDASS